MTRICTGSDCPNFRYSDDLFSDEGICTLDGGPIVAFEDVCLHGDHDDGGLDQDE